MRHSDTGRDKAFIVYDANTLKELEDYEIKIEDPKKDSTEAEEDIDYEGVADSAVFSPTSLEDF